MLSHAEATSMIDEPGNRHRSTGRATYLVGCAGGRKRYAWLTRTEDRIVVTLHGNVVAWLTPTATVLFPHGWKPEWCTQTTRQLLEALSGQRCGVIGSTREPNLYDPWEYDRAVNHGTGFWLAGRDLKPATFVNVTADTSDLEIEIAFEALAA